MATRKPTARKRTTARRKKLAPRKAVARKPRRGGLGQRAAVWLGTAVAKQGEKHLQTVNSRKDAAILRITHEGCPTCKGNGQIYTKGKNGEFTGSKPCPAKPTKAKAGRMKVALAARFGPDKNSGLIGWTCPCGKSEKPRFRDAKEATKALRTHERQKHGGQTVGGAWYAQVTDPQAAPKQPAAKPRTAPKAPAPVSKVVANSGLNDQQWIEQNGAMHPDKATANGYCWQCAGKGQLHAAFGGQQLVVVCNQCAGTGKATAKAA